MTYDAICSNCGEVEIVKAMAARFPSRHSCGGSLVRIYTPVPVHYSVPGFHTFDYSRFEKQVGKERAARVRAQNDDVTKRAKAGKLTPYEKRIEELSTNGR